MSAPLWEGVRESCVSMAKVALCHKCDGVGRTQEKVPMREEQKKRKEKEKKERKQRVSAWDGK